MIAIVLMVGLSVVCLIALLLLAIMAFVIAGEYKHGKNKQKEKTCKADEIFVKQHHDHTDL